MDYDPFSGVEIALQPTTCTCGCGWCSAHGTWHYADATEELEAERRANQTQHGTRGGRRAVRKNLASEV